MNHYASLDVGCLDNFIYYHPQHHGLMVEGVAVADLTQQYGTPFYCYSSASIVDAITQYKTALASCALPVAIHYAAKANSRLAILKVIKDNKVGLDIVSIGEMMAGMKAGFAAQDIIYSGVGKTKDDIQYAIQQGLGQLNVESFDEIKILLDVMADIKPSKNLAVAVRVNPNISAGGHEKISTGKAGDKFGIAFADALAAYQLLSTCPAVSPHAIAMHIGSQLTDAKQWEHAYRQLAKLIGYLHNEKIAIKVADIGGGMAIKYQNEIPVDMTDYAAMVSDVFAPLRSIGLEKIAIEPGRSIVGRSGLLVSRVILQKQSGDNHVVVVDAAMNDLIRPTLYHAYHGILPIQEPSFASNPLRNGKGDSIDIKLQNVVGGICETGDFFALARKLPSFKNDEILALFHVGAYGSMMSCNYNTRMMPAEILITKSTHAIMRPRQTYEDFFALEKTF